MLPLFSSCKSKIFIEPIAYIFFNSPLPDQDLSSLPDTFSHNNHDGDGLGRIQVIMW